MGRSSRGGITPHRILIAAAVALIPMVAGCEAGNNAPSLQWHRPTDGSSAGANSITISNAFVLGAPIGSVLKAGQNAGLFLGLVNTGKPDRLLRITTPDAKSVVLPGGQVTLAADRSVLLTGPSPELILQDLVRPLRGGTVITIRLHFANAGVVTMRVPVMPRTQYYTTLSPAPSPSGGTSSAPRSAKGKKSASPSPSGTP